MLISHSHKFIFIKTIKTAGTSVEVYFEKYCMPTGDWMATHAREELVTDAGIVGYRGSNPNNKKWYNHMPAAEIKDKVNADIWNNYFKFTVLRNPFDKVISNFYFKLFLFENGVNDLFFSKHSVRSEGPKDKIVAAFRQWVKEQLFTIDTSLYSIEGKPCMDYYIRYENLINDIEVVCKRLNLKFDDNLPNLKSGIRNKDIPLECFYDSETKDIIYQAFNTEFQYFNYSFPG